MDRFNILSEGEKKYQEIVNWTAGIITPMVEFVLHGANIAFSRKGEGMDVQYICKKGRNESVFSLNNTLLDIITVDRDEKPLRYDIRNADFGFFINKATNIVQQRMTLVVSFLNGVSIEKIKEYCENDPQCERAKFIEVDPVNIGK